MSRNETKGKNIVTIIIILLLVIALGVVGFLLYQSNHKKVDTSIKNLVVDTSAENMDRSSKELAARDIHFPGVPDGALSKASPLLLQNPASNGDIYLQYTVIDDATGKTVFETDLIESGQAVSWIPGETLAVGSHNLTFVEQPYYQSEDSDGWLPLTTGNNHVVITITD